MRHRNVRAALTLATAAALALTPPPVVVLPRGAALAPTRDDEISVLVVWEFAASFASPPASRDLAQSEILVKSVWPGSKHGWQLGEHTGGLQ